MDYLIQSYGPMFVEELIKHLLQSHAEKPNPTQGVAMFLASA